MIQQLFGPMKILAILLGLLPCLACAEYFELREVVAAGPGIKMVKIPKSEEEIGLSKDIIVSEKHVETAKVVDEGKEQTAVAVTLNEEGAKRLTDATKNGIPGRMRIVVLIDGKVVMAPVVQHVPLGKNLQISGSNHEESEQIARELLKKK